MKKKLVFLGLALTLSCSVIIPVAGDELNDAQSQKNYIDSKINDVTRQKQNESSKLNNIKKDKNNLANEQAKAEKSYQQAAGEVKKVQEDIASLENTIKEAEDKYEKQKELFKTRLRIMYQNSNNSYINTLAQSQNIGDFLSRLQIISTIARRDKELVVSLEESKKDVEYKKQLKEEDKKQKEKVAEDKKRVVGSIQASRAQKEAEEKKVSASLANLERQENELLKKSEELTSTIKNLKLRRSGKYVDGQMVWPAPGYGTITSEFGTRFHPILKQWKTHTGIDIGAPASAAIVAANKGTVILAGWQDGYGNTVIVDHGGDIVTLYGHCSKILVEVGQEVEAGETIAKVGSTGLATGPHLHFEVREGGKVVEPLNYVSY